MSTPDPDFAGSNAAAQPPDLGFAGSNVERQRNAERKTVSRKVMMIGAAAVVTVVALGVALGLHFSSSTDQDGTFHRPLQDRD